MTQIRPLFKGYEAANTPVIPREGRSEGGGQGRGSRGWTRRRSRQSAGHLVRRLTECAWPARACRIVREVAQVRPMRANQTAFAVLVWRVRCRSAPVSASATALASPETPPSSVEHAWHGSWGSVPCHVADVRAVLGLLLSTRVLGGPEPFVCPWLTTTRSGKHESGRNPLPTTEWPCRMLAMPLELAQVEGAGGQGSGRRAPAGSHTGSRDAQG